MRQTITRKMGLASLLAVVLFIATVPALAFSQRYELKGLQNAAYSGEIAGGPGELGSGYGPGDAYVGPMVGRQPQMLNNYALGDALLRASSRALSHGGPVNGGSFYGGPFGYHRNPVGFNARGNRGPTYRSSAYLGSGQGTGGSNVVMPGYDFSGQGATGNYLGSADVSIKGHARPSFRRKRSPRGWNSDYGGTKSGVKVDEGSSRKFRVYNGPQNGNGQGMVLGSLRGCPGRTPVKLSLRVSPN